jgi:hypothetical protein
MIERLKESMGGVIGFKVIGKLTAEDIKGFEPQIEFLIAERKHKPIGILADLSEMHGADWGARWSEMRFLQKHTDHVARMAVVGADKWEEIVAIITAGAAVLQSETRYFDTSEILHAWGGCAPPSTRKTFPYGRYLLRPASGRITIRNTWGCEVVDQILAPLLRDPADLRTSFAV